MTTITRPASKAKDAASFSRRFHTSDQHDIAQLDWDKHQETVMKGVAKRAKARAERTPQQQLLELESERRSQFGRAIRERERLNNLIAAQSKKAKVA